MSPGWAFLGSWSLSIVYTGTGRAVDPGSNFFGAKTALQRLIAHEALLCAMQTYWLLLAISQDQPKNKYVAELRDRCERAALEGYWVRPLLHSSGLGCGFACTLMRHTAIALQPFRHTSEMARRLAVT